MPKMNKIGNVEDMINVDMINYI